MRVYFDSSALVKLLIREQGSVWCEEVWADAAAPFTNAIAYVEVRAALAAAERAGRLKPSRSQSSRSRFETVWSEIGVVDCSTALIRHAGDVAEASALRGYDAVHLSSALALNAAQPLYMLTWDNDLAEATFSAGISVIRNNGA